MEKKFRITAKEMYDILDSQKYRCPLTGRELQPESTTGEFKVPLDQGGKQSAENVYLIHEDAARIRRYLNEADMARLAYDILSTKGAEFGYQAKKISEK